MRALRSLAFGIAVLLTMLLLLVTNIGVWALASLLEPAALARSAATVLREPAVRGHVAREVGADVAPVILDLGRLPDPVRRALGVPARPTQGQVATALAERVDALLADDATGGAIALVATALSRVVVDSVRRTSGDAADPGVLEVDLTPVARLVLDRIDPSGRIADAVPSGSATLRLLDSAAMAMVLPLVRLLDALRSSLPVACVVAVTLVLLLARYRVHALAWVGLCAVVAGTVSLLVASGGPVLLPRSAGMDAGRAVAVTAALDGVTAGLVTQSAVLAALGLALVVAGIAGGVVVAGGDTQGQDLRHGWDSGRLS